MLPGLSTGLPRRCNGAFCAPKHQFPRAVHNMAQVSAASAWSLRSMGGRTESPLLGRPHSHLPVTPEGQSVRRPKMFLMAMHWSPCLPAAPQTSTAPQHSLHPTGRLAQQTLPHVLCNHLLKKRGTYLDFQGVIFVNRGQLTNCLKQQRQQNIDLLS